MSEAYDTDMRSYRPQLNPDFLTLRQEKLRKERAAEQARISASRLAARKRLIEESAQRRLERENQRLLARRADRRFATMIKELQSDNRKIKVDDEFVPGLSMREIIERVAEEYGLTRADLIGESLCRDIVAVRWEAMAEVYLAHRHRGLPSIGRAFRRDHSTVLNALRKKGVYVEVRNKGAGDT